jgi:hypothetical protein
VPHARPVHANDLSEITTRNIIARHVIEGFSLAFPTLADEIAGLRIELARLRLDSANLAAAGRATIAAYLDGESRPLSYVRDELHAQGFYRQRGDS